MEKIMDKVQGLVKIGIVGVGNMGSSHCRQLYEGKVENARLVAVCDTKDERLLWAKENFGSELLTFQSIEALIESKTCDALIIATPHYDHPTMGIQALEAHLHVLVEKPIGVYTKAVEELNAVAQKTDCVFTIMYNQRTNPLYQKVKAMIDNGELGGLIRVNWVITNWFRTERYYQSGGWRATWEGEGGGVLLNQCPHQIDLIQWMCGLPKRVRAFAKYGAYHSIEVEDDVTAYFEYENGATGLFITSTGEAPGTNRLEISGEQGKLVVENDRLVFYKNSESVFEYSRTTEELFKPPTMEAIDIEVSGETTAHVGIMQNFVNAILFNEKQLAPGVEGIRGLALSNAMHMSSWQDAWVELPIKGDVYLELLQEKIKQSNFKKVTKEINVDLSGSH
jgi:predicted dehydrogenase